MHPVRRFLPLAAVVTGTLVFGCGGEKRPATTAGATTTTSAEAAQNQINELQRERDEAQANLAQERAARERDRQSYTQQTSAQSEHDDLEMRVVDALQKADQDIQSMHDKLGRAGTKQRASMDQSIRDAEQQKAKLYSQLRRLHSETGESWDTFKSEVESTITDLNRSLMSMPETSETTTQPSKAKQPSKSKQPSKPSDESQQPMQHPKQQPMQHPMQHPMQQPAPEPSQPTP